MAVEYTYLRRQKVANKKDKKQNQNIFQKVYIYAGRMACKGWAGGSKGHTVRVART